MASFVEVVIGILIAVALVSPVATNTTTASTALAAFSSAQALVILIPLVFVAGVLLWAWKGASHAEGTLTFDYAGNASTAASP